MSIIVRFISNLESVEKDMKNGNERVPSPNLPLVLYTNSDLPIRGLGSNFII